VTYSLLPSAEGWGEGKDAAAAFATFPRRPTPPG
jgi:hypothetical protein